MRLKCALIAEAGGIATKALSRVIPMIHLGLSEIEVARILRSPA